MRRWLLAIVGFVLFAVPVFAGGLFDRGDGETEEPAPESQESVPIEVEVPEWVQYILDENYLPLYPGPEGGGYIGTGIGGTRQAAEAAAAVDFAGSVSTVVNSGVVEQREESSSGESEFSVVIESEVRSQAIISGLDPLVWEDPRSGIHYALFRATVEEYERKLDEWIITMESLSEAEQRREMQRLQEERAAAERRLEEIRLEELQQQVREADRRMRANRHAAFLSQSFPQVERGVPTGYVPDGMGVSATYRGEDGGGSADLGIDFGVARMVHLNLGTSGLRTVGEDDKLAGQLHARLLVNLIRRVGLVTHTTVAIGGWGGNSFYDWDTGDGAGGAFVTADVLLPEFFHTRYSLYAGNDLLNVRAMWYPFWESIESAVAVRATTQFEFTDPGYTDGAEDGSYFGVGLVFAPVDGGWISIDTRNFSTISGTLTIAF